MNSMSDKLGKVFAEQVALIEELRAQSYHDALTGLLNRDGFRQRLAAELESAHSVPNGSLLLIHLNLLAELNQRHGTERGDEVLQAAADVLRKTCEEFREGFAGRLSGAGFAAYLPGLGVDQLDGFAERLMQKMLGLPTIKTLLQDNLVHVGLASAQDGDDCRNLLARADMSLRQAQSRGRSGWQRYANIAAQSPLDEVRQASEWQAILQEVIGTRNLLLYGQDIYSLATDEKSPPRPAFRQVLARIEVDHRVLPAGLFLPMAERFAMMPAMDRLVIEKVLDRMRADPSLHLSVALSESSLAHEGFIDGLLAQLRDIRVIAGRLRFDVPEYALIYHEREVAALCQAGMSLGFTVAIDRFGVSAVPYSYLQRLRLEAIRIDPSFVRGIDQHPENQFFLRMAAQMAHSQSVRVIGIGVETEAEWHTLQGLGIDMAMGYVWGRPQALEPQRTE
jgi:diguanylate cyclase (GGDEF)-like protein